MIAYGIVEHDQHWFRQYLSLVRHQAISWTNADLVSFRPLIPNFTEKWLFTNSHPWLKFKWKRVFLFKPNTFGMLSVLKILTIPFLSQPKLQAKVSATVRLFGGDSSHMPFFDWQSFQENTLYPLAIIHMEHINALDFDDKSERNLCFSFGNLGIIFNGASAQLFPPREKWLFGWVRGHPPANGGRD